VIPSYITTSYRQQQWFLLCDACRRQDHKTVRPPTAFKGDAKAALLPDTICRATPRLAEEVRSAGARSEIIRQGRLYAEDGSAQAPHPYVASNEELRIRRHKRVIGGAAPRCSTPSSSAGAHRGTTTRRNPSDPRITHALTLEVDAFGAAR
jgi:hypothetical protein